MGGHPPPPPPPPPRAGARASAPPCVPPALGCPAQQNGRTARGGSGEQLPWGRLAIPRGSSRRGWALAGGLGPDNVAEAAALARPDLVDVSSGVAGPDGVRKDPGLVAAFVRNARAPPA